jgi:abortive infection bacteriophage resistance protein
MAGTQLVEIAIRARIAYILGKRDPFAHVDRACLDPTESRKSRKRQGTSKSVFDWWRIEYNRLQEQQRTETFVRHNLKKYGEPLPIWVACEFLDFGATSHLFQLMLYPDRQAVANCVGLRKEAELRSWLTALNYVRNVCAHNSRLWNRILTVKPKIDGRNLPEELSQLSNQSNNKIYCVLAITAYLVKKLIPDSDWVSDMAEVIRSFPDIPMRSITEMGIPANWDKEKLRNEEHTNGDE